MNDDKIPHLATDDVPASLAQVTPATLYALYHALSPLAMTFPQVQDWYVDREQHYRHVADVQASREQLFVLTQHHSEQVWTQHPEVLWHHPTTLRSTSVGDVVVHSQTGEAWMFLPHTFYALPSCLPDHAQGATHVH